MKEKVTFTNNRGLRLVARMIGHEKGEIRPVVIFAHGLKSSKNSPRNFSIARDLVDKGFCCFLPDFTGHGESEGEISDLTLEQFIQDLDASLNYIDRRKEIDPMRIGICGSRMGGMAAMVKAAADGRVRALTLCTVTAEGYHEYARKVDIPVMIVQGDEDPLMRGSRTHHERLATGKKLVLIKGADHLYSKEVHLKEAQEAIVQWFVEELGSEDPDPGIFKDRRDAGRELAPGLKNYKNRKGVIVLALPRGGVVTGYEVASYLHCPLDIIIIRKLGFPGQPELAIGAVSETGAVVLNEYLISSGGISEEYIDREISYQKGEIERRVGLYRKGKGIPHLRGKTIILVDDGVATGATMKAAISTLKVEGVAKLIAALPVAPPDTAEELRQMVDEFFCLETPSYFMAVGSFYQDFTQVRDEEVVEILESSRVDKNVKAL